MTMTTPMMIRQGDILLRPVQAPAGVDESAARPGRIVLAEGEATGHEHAVEGTLLAATVDGRALLRVIEGVMTHPDHDPIPAPVPPGWYEVIRQRVYTPVSPRTVMD
jgi:hypothetical protein